MEFAIFSPPSSIRLLFIFLYLYGWLCLQSQENQDIGFYCTYLRLFDQPLHVVLRQENTGFSKSSGKIGQILEASFCHPLLFPRLIQGLIHPIGMLMASLRTHHKLYTIRSIHFIVRPRPAGS